MGLPDQSEQCRNLCQTKPSQVASLNFRHQSKQFYEYLKVDLANVLKRVYKYHIAYKTILYELEEKGMFAPSNGGYIYLKKLYSTIGLIGYFEAAQFLNINPSNNDEYLILL